MEKKVLTFAVLSIIVLVGYPVLLKKIYPHYNDQVKSASLLPSARTTTPAVAAEENPANDYAAAQDVAFKNDKLKLLFNQKGGGLREIAFLDFMDSEKGGPIKLISAKSSEAAPLSVALITPAPGLEHSNYKTTNIKDGVVFESDLLNGVKVSKQYVFHRSGYSADMTLTFKNDSAIPMDLQYQIFAGSRIPPRHAIDLQYIEADFFTSAENKSHLKHLKESKLGKKVESEGPVDWIAIKDRHFSVIIKPKALRSFTGEVAGLGKRQFSAAAISPKLTLAPHASVTQEFLVYIGPNDLNELLPLGLEDIVNFGKLDLVGKVFIGGLEMLHKIFRNYGVAIIALTLLINLMLFPFTRQSFFSMKRMQLIQPQVNKLRTQFKDNPQRLNKEMMELYQKNKVNPFGGCLPMVLQMPVFIALYVAISKFVRLIDAPFLWVRDLSSPDHVALPFTLPFAGNEIHVLPLIMIAGMAIQQTLTRMNMEGQDPAMAEQQKMMAIMMPIIFGFIFYAMPSALVLYWLTNTIFMTSYQLYLKRSSAA